MSKYSMLSALGYGASQSVTERTQATLSKYNLFGVIIHDPKAHPDFHYEFGRLFEKLDYISGQNFLFFGLTNPPDDWVNIHILERNYISIWDREDSLHPSRSLYEADDSVSAYVLAQQLKVDFDDLPIIVLTNNFSLNQYRVVKTCSHSIEKQITEIGFFCSQNKTGFSIENDLAFNKLIDEIDLCGGSSLISNEEALSNSLVDFLSFFIKKSDTEDARKAKQLIPSIVNKYSRLIRNHDDPKRIEQLNLFLLGSLANSIRGEVFRPIISISSDIEYESKIILNTFNKVFPFFGDLANIHNDNNYNEVDYSPLIISLGKIFEIEVNLSIVHWIRQELGIELPDYYKKRKDVDKDYIVVPNFPNSRSIDFNNGNGTKWFPPGIGQSELAFRNYCEQGNIPDEIDNCKEFLFNWKRIRLFRNESAHSIILNHGDFQEVLSVFNLLNSNDRFDQLTSIKSSLRGL